MSNTHESVTNYYKPLFSHEASLKTNICTIPQSHKLSTPQLRKIQSQIHPDILADTFGCGSPIPCDSALRSCHILDLGCGSGRDVFCSAALVGNGGKAIGLDMTDLALKKAREYTKYHLEKFGLDDKVVEFQDGKIEDLSFAADDSLDVVISNCVVNLSNDKKKVFSEVYRVLKEGGEIYFSDVYADRRIPLELQGDEELWGECLSGALYWNDFISLMREVGFPDVRVVNCTRIALEGADIKDNKEVNQIGFYSITVRAFKLTDKLEAFEEDYQQEVRYLGQDSLRFDLNYTFAPGSLVKVSSNTASILKNSRYGSLFEVSDKKAHQGEFIVPQQNWDAIRQCTDSSGGSCCAPSNTEEKKKESCCGGKKSC